MVGKSKCRHKYPAKRKSATRKGTAAGPPRKLAEPQRVTITLEAAQVEWLKQQAPTVSEAIRALIQKDIAEW